MELAVFLSKTLHVVEDLLYTIEDVIHSARFDDTVIKISEMSSYINNVNALVS